MHFAYLAHRCPAIRRLPLLGRRYLNTGYSGRGHLVTGILLAGLMLTAQSGRTDEPAAPTGPPATAPTAAPLAASHDLTNPAIDPAVLEEVDRRVAELDDNSFARRQQAFDRLGELVGQPQMAGPLARRFAQVLGLPETSYEVRSQLDRLAKRLPAGGAAVDEPATEASLGPLLDELNNPVFVRRDLALRRLKAIAGQTELVGPLWLELKRRLGNTAIAPSARRVFEPLVDQVHGAWLLADPKLVQLPVPRTRTSCGGLTKQAGWMSCKPTDATNALPPSANCWT